MSTPEWRFCPLCGRGLELRPQPGPDAPRPACPTGHFVHYDNPKPATIALVEHPDGRVLTLRRAIEPMRGCWELPGGFVEPLEPPEDTVRREVREETGLQVEVTGFLGAFPSRYGHTGIRTLDLAFRCRPQDGTAVRLSDESSEHRWVALAEVPELAFEAERRAVAALRDLRGG